MHRRQTPSGQSAAQTQGLAQLYLPLPGLMAVPPAAGLPPCVTHTHTHTHVHTGTHTDTHSCICTRAHMYAHTHTHFLGPLFMLKAPPRLLIWVNVRGPAVVPPRSGGADATPLSSRRDAKHAGPSSAKKACSEMGRNCGGHGRQTGSGLWRGDGPLLCLL